MKLKYLIILILILNVTLISAKEFTIEKNKILTYKEIPFKLIQVGSSRTIKLQIKEIEKLIEHDKEIILYDIKIKNLDANYVFQTAKISLELTAECLTNEDCEKIKPKPCVSSFCDYRTCKFSEIQGCSFKNECRSIGSFEEIDDKLSYCSEDGSWKPRKPYKSKCEHNYECLSNLCNNFCSTHIFGGKKMAPAWILIVIGSLLLIESLFLLLKPKIARTIIKNLALNFSNKTWRILAIIELVIALILIIWAII